MKSAQVIVLIVTLLLSAVSSAVLRGNVHSLTSCAEDSRSPEMKLRQDSSDSMSQTLSFSSIHTRASSTMTKKKRFYNYLEVTRTAIVLYECPISGCRVRRFKWRADYSWNTAVFGLEALENIQSFDHITQRTND